MSFQTKIVTDPGFPVREIERCIRDALADEARNQQMLRPRRASAGEPEIDSLVVIEIICVVEEMLGVSLPASFSPCGGYEDVEACVADLTAQVRAVWPNPVKEKQHHE